MPILEKKKANAYGRDSILARLLNPSGGLRSPAKPPQHRRKRQKLHRPLGRAISGRRKALIEPILGVLKEQRGRGNAHDMHWTKSLAITASNLTRLLSTPQAAR
jgi:hypothetical protein